MVSPRLAEESAVGTGTRRLTADFPACGGSRRSLRSAEHVGAGSMSLLTEAWKEIVTSGGRGHFSCTTRPHPIKTSTRFGTEGSKVQILSPRPIQSPKRPASAGLFAVPALSFSLCAPRFHPRATLLQILSAARFPRKYLRRDSQSRRRRSDRYADVMFQRVGRDRWEAPDRRIFMQMSRIETPRAPVSIGAVGAPIA